MIGKYIRGSRHLMRNVENLETRKLLIINSNRIYKGHVFRLNNELYIFQDVYGERIASHTSLIENSNGREVVSHMSNMYSREMRLPKSGCKTLSDLCFVLYLLPKDFDEEYEQFYKSNKKLLTPIFSKYVPQSDAISMFFYTQCHETPNLCAWALTNIFKHHVDIALVINIVNWFNKYGKNGSKLAKGSATSYNGIDSLLALENEASKIRSAKRSNDVINTFNTTQKKLLKSVDLTEKDTKILSKFGTLSNVKRTNFIQKVSTFEDPQEILKQMALLANVHFEWKEESLIEYINKADNIACNVIFHENHIILVEVKNYDTVKYLAKSTNWCISKNKKYWNDYIERRKDAKQYIIFDFNKEEDDELSIVGFTINGRKGITNAHSFTNNNLMGSGLSNINIESWFSNSHNIHDIISKCNIPITALIPKRPSRFAWNKDSFITYLEQCVGKKYDILYSEGGKLAFTVTNEGISYLFGSDYDRVYDFGYSSAEKHFFFVDFNKKEDDGNRILFGLIFKNEDGEETCGVVFNAYCQQTHFLFDNLLDEFNLPYDIICRVDDKVNRFYSTVKRCNKEGIKSLINNPQVLKELKKEDIHTRSTLSNAFEQSLLSYRTFSFIDAIYESGHTLSEFISQKKISMVLGCLLNDAAAHLQVARCSNLPTEEDFENLLAKRIGNSEKCLGVGSFLSAKKIIDNEFDTLNFDVVLARCGNLASYHKPIANYVLEIAVEKISFNGGSTEGLYHFVNIARTLSNYSILVEALKKDISSEVGKYIVSQLPLSFKKKVDVVEYVKAFA